MNRISFSLLSHSLYRLRSPNQILFILPILPSCLKKPVQKKLDKPQVEGVGSGVGKQGAGFGAIVGNKQVDVGQVAEFE
jgi:hypothetical protein